MRNVTENTASLISDVEQRKGGESPQKKLLKQQTGAQRLPSKRHYYCADGQAVNKYRLAQAVIQ
ncbi:hypothetical protein D8682_04095 [Buttiauxella sp. 3AFRM03]|nr:hypothetical protein D8682_04095 [Buttiauxella sp. 3AFRM03]